MHTTVYLKELSVTITATQITIITIITNHLISNQKKRETMVDENTRHDYELDESLETLTADKCLFCENEELEYDPTVDEIWCYQCEKYIDDENLTLKNYDENQSNIYDNHEDTFNLWD